MFTVFCLVVNCSDPGIPANSIRESKIEHGNFTYGTVVFYDCNPGYFLFGSSVLVCQPNGHWDKPLPECISKYLRINIIIHSRLLEADCSLSYLSEVCLLIIVFFANSLYIHIISEHIHSQFPFTVNMKGHRF